MCVEVSVGRLGHLCSCPGLAVQLVEGGEVSLVQGAQGQAGEQGSRDLPHQLRGVSIFTKLHREGLCLQAGPE